MANMLRISSAASLAMHMMTYIAGSPGTLHTTEDVAHELDVSVHHLAKVRQRLSRAGFLQAQRGPGGGLRLARPASKITLLDIFEEIEGPINSVTCLFDEAECTREACILGGLIESTNRHVKRYMEKTTLSKLVNKR